MPPPIKVELLPYSPDWKLAARRENLRLSRALERSIVVVHHIGSTAIPGIHAKPIIDLMPVVRSVNGLDEQASIFRELGYQYWGEYGIPGRRYCTLDEPATGRRQFQLHCFESDSHQIESHLAFRDWLQTDSVAAQQYDAEKRRCRELHPEHSHAYSDAKAAWIAAHLPVALAQFRSPP